MKIKVFDGIDHCITENINKNNLLPQPDSNSSSNHTANSNYDIENGILSVMHEMDKDRVI